MKYREPDQIDWDNYNPQSGKFRRPPVPLGPDGKAIIFYAQLPIQIGMELDKEEFRQYLFDPIVLVRSGAEADGYEIRFTRASIKPWVDQKTGKSRNASPAGNVLRAAGILAKPQRTAEYDAAMKLASGKVVPVTLDWMAYNKDTGERVRGYSNFPMDPERPGQRMAILRAGDAYTVSDNKGNVTDKKVVQAEVLFANAIIRNFIDPSRSKK